MISFLVLIKDFSKLDGVFSFLLIVVKGVIFFRLGFFWGFIVAKKKLN